MTKNRASSLRIAILELCKFCESIEYVWIWSNIDLIDLVDAEKRNQIELFSLQCLCSAALLVPVRCDSRLLFEILNDKFCLSVIPCGLFIFWNLATTTTRAGLCFWNDFSKIMAKIPIKLSNCTSLFCCELCTNYNFICSNSKRWDITPGNAPVLTSMVVRESTSWNGIQ